MVRLLPSGALIVAPSAMVRFDRFVVSFTTQDEPALIVLLAAAKASFTWSTAAKGSTSIAAIPTKTKDLKNLFLVIIFVSLARYRVTEANLKHGKTLNRINESSESWPIEAHWHF
jgi:hypothetical protein